MPSNWSRHIRHIAGAILAVIVATVVPAGAQPSNPPLKVSPDGRPLEMVFSDDFRTFRRWTAGTGIWRTTFGDGTQLGLDRRSLPSNGELQLYVDPDIADGRGSLGLNPFSVDGGGLEITATPATAEIVPKIRNYAYMSGVITTQPSFAQTYGYFEMCAKLPGGKGLWPAFWLLPADQSWPPEIDVMESVGDPTTIYMTAHSTTGKAEGIEAHISKDAFHVFAISWDPNELIWYVDGRESGRQPTPVNMHKPMYMLANLAVGGTWPGSPDDTTHFPAKLTIQYIRAYRFAR